jgi:hypothetical protein
MSIELEPPKGKIVKLWIQLFGLVLWFGTTYAQFLNFDVEIGDDTQYSQIVLGLGALVSAVAIGLTIRAPAVFRIARTARFWYVATILGLLVIVFLIGLYHYLIVSWGCIMPSGRSLLKGSILTSDFSESVRLGANECNEFSNSPGRSDTLYERGSILLRFELIGLVYIIIWAVLSFLIVSVAQSFKVRRNLL